MTIYIDTIASYLPDVANIAEGDKGLFDDLKIPFSSRKYLIDGGYENISHNRSEITNVVSNLLNKVSKAHEDPFDEIDGVVLCTESFHILSEVKEIGSIDDFRTWITKQLAAIGINNAAIYANWGQGCGNASTTLMLADSLICSQSAKTILCLFFDQHPKQSNRVIDDTNLRGDGGAALVVSGNKGSVALKKFHHYSDLSMSTGFQDLDFFNRYLLIKNMISNAIRSFENRYQVKANSYSSVIMDSFHDMYIQLIAEDLKLGSFITPSKKKGGHIPPIDTILGIESFINDNKDDIRQEILAINIGRFSVGIFELGLF